MASGLTATTRFVGLLVGIAALGAVRAQVAPRSFIPGGVAAGLDAETAAELAKHVTVGRHPGHRRYGAGGAATERLANRQCGLRRWIRCGGVAGGRVCRGDGAVHGASGAARRDVAGHGWQHRRHGPESRWQLVAPYKELTGVPENLTQVIFIEVKHGNFFVGSVPPDTDQISVEGHLRTGRSLEAKRSLVERIVEAVAQDAAMPKSHVC